MLDLCLQKYHEFVWIKVLSASYSSYRFLLCVKQSVSIFSEQRITLLYQVLEMTLIDAVKEKQFRGVAVSLIALPVKVQLKMLRGELIQHGIFIKQKATRELMDCIFYALMYYI